MDRSHSTLVLAILLVGSLTLAPAATAAKRLKPPSRTMIAQYNQVAVVVAKSSPEAGKVLLKKKKNLWGKMPGTIVARLDTAGFEGLEWGTRYVVAYTDVRRNPLDTASIELDPEGPRVIDLTMVGPALFEDSDVLRRVLETSKRAEVDLGRSFLEDLVALLGDSEPRAQRFAITEFYLRAELQHNLRSADLGVFRAQITSKDQLPEARALLIESFVEQPDPIRGAWLVEAAREIVAGADTELDLASTWPLLIKTAIQALKKDGGTADGPLLARHFVSNSPGVATAALAALVVLEPDRAAQRAREVLGRADLHATTRQAMEGYLERYRRGEIGG